MTLKHSRVRSHPHRIPSGVIMVSSDLKWTLLEPSVRVSPRLRAWSFLSEWKIIERDNLLVILCRH